MHNNWLCENDLYNIEKIIPLLFQLILENKDYTSFKKKKTIINLEGKKLVG